ncbi:MAG: pilus assembly protein [Myxococcales bacterium]|nr:pilus assembly protein [Myxococcales bacterium]MCB9707391.1 pilus assembly protein [Myxococcales bacterium]
MKLFREKKGVVYVEFLAVFLPVFIMCLAIIQLALLSAARLIIQHAAIRGARAAVVILDDDPKYYGGVARNCLTGGSSGVVQSVMTTLAKIGNTQLPEGMKPESFDKLDQLQARASNAGPRFEAIRAAVYTPLLTIAPEPWQVWKKESIASAVGFYPESRLLSGILFNQGVAVVTLPSSETANDAQYSIAPDANVTVRVTYLFHCAVPLVSALMCKKMSAILVDDDPEEDSDQALTHEQIISRELGHAEIPALQFMIGATGSRFKVFRVQATLPNQAAKYDYLSETEADEETGDSEKKEDTPACAPFEEIEE